MQALEGWRKRRRGEMNVGRIQIADAMRELDAARKARKRKQDEEMKRMGVQKRFEFGGMSGGRRRTGNDDDYDEDEDVAETPSLVIDVSQVQI